MASRDSSVNVVSRVHHYFSFSQDFVDNSHFGCEIHVLFKNFKIQNNRPHKHIAYGLASHYFFTLSDQEFNE